MHIAYSDWLLSVSDMHLMFLRVLSWFDSSVVFTVEYFIFQIYRSLFIHSHSEEHLGCFQVWTVMNKAAI